MQMRIAAALTAAVVLAAFARSDAATKQISIVQTENKSDKYAYVTVYGIEQDFKDEAGRVVIEATNKVSSTLGLSSSLSTDKNQGAWCVAPGATDKHSLTAAIHSVQIELKGNHCAASEKVVYDTKVPFLGVNTEQGTLLITGGPKTLGIAPANIPGGGTINRNEPGGPASTIEKVPYHVATSKG